MKLIKLLSAALSVGTALATRDAAAVQLPIGSMAPSDAGRAKLVSLSGPVLQHNFPDPHVVAHGGWWWAFGTSNWPSERPHVQVATSWDFGEWARMHFDPLFETGAWAVGNLTLSPSIMQRADGKWVMFYSNPLILKPATHCIGTALADGVSGPYAPTGEIPLLCALKHGGAIHPSGFRDADGTPYVLYKADGNGRGNGGKCADEQHASASEAATTPLMLQRLSHDLLDTVGEPVQLLTNGPEDGANLESPSLVRSKSGTYYLFFSTHCSGAPESEVQYATASSINGPYMRRGLFIETGTRSGVVAPGGLSVGADGEHALFHADCEWGRCLFKAEVELE